MNEKIDLIKILKDCPEGMELNCLMYEDVYFDYVDELNIIHCYIQHETHRTSLTFNQHGTPNSDLKSKCVIFPKGKTSWEGFQRPFIDGDVVFYDDTIAIFKEWGDETLFRTYVTQYLCCNSLLGMNVPLFGKSVRNEIRLATEEERKMLFDIIKSNGFKWNAETKTLEKVLKEDKAFKNGDIIVSEFGNIAIFSHTEKNDRGRNVVYYHCLYSHGIVGKFKASAGCGIGYVEDCRSATEHERELMMEAVRKYGFHWNPETKTLEKLIIPKFKIGNNIQSKTDNNDKFTITDIDNGCYYGRGKGHEFLIPIVKQDNWELIPYKFDIETLNHFDKVLVRQYDLSPWCVDFFSYYDKEGGYAVCTGEIHYDYCVPYNDDTKHLVSKVDDAPEFYRFWEKNL